VIRARFSCYSKDSTIADNLFFYELAVSKG
jgi:hypothetical protein